MVGATSYSPHTDDYPFLVHEIIEQMLSIKAGQIFIDTPVARSYIFPW